MADLTQIETALRNAHDAGDTEAATRLAQHYREMSRKQVQDPSILERVGSGISATARTAGGLVGLASQLPRVGAELVFSDADIGTAFERSESSNPMTYVNELSKPNELTQRGMEVQGEGIDAIGRGLGRLAKAGGNLMGAGFTDEEYKRLQKNAKTPEERKHWEELEAAEVSGTEFLGNFLPLGGVNGKRGFKFSHKEDKAPSSVISRLEEEARKTTEPKNHAEDYQFWKERAEKMTEDARNTAIPMPDKFTDPTLPKIDESLITRGAEREQPLPQIIDPDVLASQKALKGAPEPLRDPLMEMPPEQLYKPQGDLQGPPPRTPNLSTELGAQPRPNVPDTVAMATNHTHPTNEFMLRPEYLNADPTVQTLLRQEVQRLTEAQKGGVVGREAAKELRAIRQELERHGWEGYGSGDKPGLFGFGKETALPIEKTGTRDTRTFPSAGKPFDSTRGTTGRFIPKSQRGAISHDLLGTGKVADLLSKLGPTNLLKKYKGTFNPKALDFAIRDSLDPKSRSRLVWVSPAQFLELAKNRFPEHRPKDAQAMRDMAAPKIRNVREGLRSSEGLRDIPFLSIDAGRVTGHEGRHRAHTMGKMGVDLMPVILRDSMHRVESGPLPYHQLLSEDKKVVDISGIKEVFPNGQRQLGQTRAGNSQRGSAPNVGQSPLLKGLFKRFEKKPDVETTKHESNVSTVEATKALPGVSKVYNGIDIPPLEPEAAKAYMADWIENGKDLSNLENFTAQTVKAGANLLAKEKRNPLIRHAYENVDQALKHAAEQIEYKVKPLTEAALNFSRKELGEINKALTLAEGKFEWTREQLESAGMKPEPAQWIQDFRAAMNSVLEAENAARVLRGEKPVPARLGYMAGRFMGDYRTLVRDSKGDVVYVISENNKILHDWALRDVKKNLSQESYKYETLPYQRGSSKIGEALDAGYAAFMRQLVTDDPRAAAVESVYKEWKDKTSSFYLGQNQHFKGKSKDAVGGAEGLKITKSLEQNAVDSIHAQINYMESALMWSEMQKAAQNILKLTGDEVFNGKKDNSVNYAREYLYNALGHRVNSIGHLSEGIAKFLSPVIGEAGIKDVGGWVRAGLNAKLLGGPINMGFLLPNIIQVVNALPEASSILGRVGNKGGIATAQVMEGAVKIFKQGDAYWQDAARYASDQHVAKSAIDIDTKDIGSVRGLRTVDKVWNGPRRFVEESTRMSVFGGFVQIFKKAGYEKDKAFKMAADATERSMADYRNQETAMVFSSGGFLGQNAQFLQKYLFNFVNQETAFLSNKEFKAASGLLAINLVTAGVAGMIGIQTYSAVAALWNDLMFDKTGIRLPSVKEFAIKNNAPDWLTYGPVSTMLGADVSSRMGMANMVPASPVEAMFPGGSEVVNSASGVKDIATGKWREGLHKLNPTSTKFITEQAFFSKDRPDGKRIPIHPDKKEPVGTVDSTGQPWARTTRDELMRGIGFRSLSEAKDKDKSYAVGMENLAVSKAVTDIIKDFGNKSYWAKTNFEKTAAAQRAAKRLVAVGANPDTVAAKLEMELMKQATTPEQRILIGNDVMKIKRYMEYGTKTGTR